MAATGPSNISLRPATPTDIPAIAAVLHETTLETPWDRLRFGAIDRQVWYDHLKKGLSESLLAKQPAIITAAIDSDTNEIVGFVELEKLDSEMSENVPGPAKPQGEKPAKEQPEGFNTDAIMAYYNAMIVVREKAVGEKPYIHVLDLAVKATHRRRGIGTWLMKTAMDYARQEGEMLYFEATPAGVPLYEGLGFERLGSIEVDMEPYGGYGKHEDIAMIWRPETCRQ